MSDPNDLDVMAMAEGGTAALDELIEKGPPKVPRGKRRDDPKAGWKQTNIRMDPAIKGRLKRLGESLGVPIEELVHKALLRFLEDLEEGEIKLEVTWAVTRKTVL